MVGAGIGMALGGWLRGALFDLSGTYQWGVVAVAVAGCACLHFALCPVPAASLTGTIDSGNRQFVSDKPRRD